MVDEPRAGPSKPSRKAQVEHDPDFPNEGVRELSRTPLENRVEEHVGVVDHKRSAGRNGYRERAWGVRAARYQPKVPRVRGELLSIREREVLGPCVDPREGGALWTSFLRSPVACGLFCGVRLVTGTAPAGAKGAIEGVLQRASWQHCRTHAARNALPWSSRQPSRWWELPFAPSLLSRARKVPPNSGAGPRKEQATAEQPESMAG
jgi:transposase-like protein